MLLMLLGLFHTEHQQQLFRHVISQTVADVQITAVSAAAALSRRPGAVRREHRHTLSLDLSFCHLATAFRRIVTSDNNAKLTKTLQ